VSNRIKQLRKAKKISQKTLAENVGISTSAIGMYEQGRRDPDTNTLLKIAKALNSSVDFLIGASEIIGEFDIESISKGIAENLMDNPALMFSGDCYTKQELDELCEVIQGTVERVLTQRLSPCDQKEKKGETD